MSIITILRSTLLIASLSTLICCDSTDEDYKPGKNKVDVDFTTVGKGELNGNGAENIPQQQIIIRSSSRWNDLLAQMNSLNNEANGFTETDFNFSNVILIAVFDELQSNGGYSIDITNVFQTDGEIFVEVGKLQKGDDTPLITQPYHIVKFSKTDVPISFK